MRFFLENKYLYMWTLYFLLYSLFVYGWGLMMLINVLNVFIAKPGEK